MPAPRRRAPGAGRKSLGGTVGSGPSPMVRFRVAEEVWDRLHAAPGVSPHDVAREAMLAGLAAVLRRLAPR